MSNHLALLARYTQPETYPMNYRQAKHLVFCLRNHGAVLTDSLLAEFRYGVEWSLRGAASENLISYEQLEQLLSEVQS